MSGDRIDLFACRCGQTLCLRPGTVADCCPTHPADAEVAVPVGNKCHCLERATWIIRAVHPHAPINRPALRTWACCDEHLAEAARFVIAALDPDAVYSLVLRAES